MFEISLVCKTLHAISLFYCWVHFHFVAFVHAICDAQKYSTFKVCFVMDNWEESQSIMFKALLFIVLLDMIVSLWKKIFDSHK